MPALLIRHRVSNYGTWKVGFDAQDTVRRAHGCQRCLLFRGAGDDDEILILLEWDEVDRAWMFAQSDEMQAALQQPDVADEPDLWLLSDSSRMRI